MIKRLQCFFNGRHEPSRHPLGGFTCPCGFASNDLEQMGALDDGYVSPTRRVFSRKNREITRTSAWEQTRGGY